MKFFLIGLFFVFLGLFWWVPGFYVLPPKTPLLQSDVSKPPHQGVGVFLINLDRSPDRLKNMVPQVQQLGLPWTRIPAVDGQALSKETLHTLTDLRSFRRNMGRFPRTGTLGCSLSHINVWKAFLASPYQYALILEDDVVFDPKELCKVIDDLKKRAQDWDLCTFEIHHRGFPLKLSALPSGRKLATYLFPVTHSGGYLINRKAARMLFEKSLPLVLPLDHFFTRTWEMPFKFRGLEPRLMHQQGEAVISRTSETSAEKWDRFFWRLQHAIFVAKTALIWFFNRLIL